MWSGSPMVMTHRAPELLRCLSCHSLNPTARKNGLAIVSASLPPYVNEKGSGSEDDDEATTTTTTAAAKAGAAPATRRQTATAEPHRRS